LRRRREGEAFLLLQPLSLRHWGGRPPTWHPCYPCQPPSPSLRPWQHRLPSRRLSYCDAIPHGCPEGGSCGRSGSPWQSFIGGGGGSSPAAAAANPRRRSCGRPIRGGAAPRGRRVPGSVVGGGEKAEGERDATPWAKVSPPTNADDWAIRAKVSLGTLMVP
jgi:hypothetical protein